ncbi:MAG: hypothetical protein ACW98W_18605 [Candidatus Hodarchaeales archaeon]
MSLPKQERDKLRKTATDLDIGMNELLLYAFQALCINFERGNVKKEDLVIWKSNGRSIV